LIEKIESNWNYWNIENKENITTKVLKEAFSGDEDSIIEKGGTKCVSIAYKIVPKSIEELQVVKYEIK